MKKISTLVLSLAIPFVIHAATYDDLMRAVKLGDNTEVISLLNKGVDVNTTDMDGNTLIIIAAREGNTELVTTLINYRAKINARNRHGDTALRLAALKGNQDMVQRLVKAGAHVNMPDWTPLIYASFNGHVDVVDYLLKNGAEINSASRNGTTALMAALRQGHIPVAKLLLATPGLEINKTNEANETALDIALRTNNTSLLDAIRGLGGRSANSVTLELK